MIRAAYHTLGLQSFLTAGEKEARAWTIRSGATAAEAAGASTPISNADSSPPRWWTMRRWWKQALGGGKTKGLVRTEVGHEAYVDCCLPKCRRRRVCGWGGADVQDSRPAIRMAKPSTPNGESPWRQGRRRGNSSRNSQALGPFGRGIAEGNDSGGGHCTLRREMPNPNERFVDRHIGPGPDDIDKMLATIGAANLDDLITETIPGSIVDTVLDLPPPCPRARRSRSCGSWPPRTWS